MSWLRWRWELVRLRHRERHLEWILSMWADPDAEQRLAMVRWARRRLEAVEP